MIVPKRSFNGWQRVNGRKRRDIMAHMAMRSMSAVMDDFTNAVFWAIRSMENLLDELEPLRGKLDLQLEYEALGCPFGKSKRGLKRWLKSKPYGVLEAEVIK
jgi:hypothetical protein